MEKISVIKLLIKEGNFNESIEKCKEAIQSNKEENPGDFYFFMGEAYYKLRKFKLAIENYQNSANLNNNPALAYSKIGTTYIDLHDYKSAEIYFDIALYCNYIDAIKGKGTVYFNKENYEEAISCYEKALENRKNDASLYYELGYFHAEKGLYQEAIENYSKAIEIDSTYLNAYLYWGNALYMQGLTSEAIKKCEEAIEKCDKSRKICKENPQECNVTDECNKVNRKCLKAKDLDPAIVYAYHNISVFHWALGNYKASKAGWYIACREYSSILEDKKNYHSDLYLHYGWVLREQLGNFYKSEKVLKDGLRINPQNTGILFNLMTLYLERSEELPKNGMNNNCTLAYNQAKEYFLKAEYILKQYPDLNDNTWLQYELGNIYLKMGMDNEAKIYLEKALEKKHNIPEVYNSLGILYCRKEDFIKAIYYFENSHLHDFNNLKTWCNLAEALLKLNPKELKQIEKAEAEYRKILQCAPNYIESQIGLGEVYLAMAEISSKDFYEDAIKYFTNAIELSENGYGSRYLKTKEHVAILYSRGFARVKFFMRSKFFKSDDFLHKALEDFRLCTVLDPNHTKAERAKQRLEIYLSKYSPRWLSQKVAPWLVIIPAFYILFITQLSIFSNKPIVFMDAVTYITLTFSSLMFLVIGICLPEIHKLKGAGIEMEKDSTEQITSCKSLELI